MTEDPRIDPDLSRILDAFAASAAHFRTGAMFCAAVGVLITVLGIARGIWFIAVIGAALGVCLTWLMIWSQRKSSDPDRSPVLRAVALAPETVTKVVHMTASSSSGAFKTHWLRVHIDSGKARGIKVDEAELVSMAQAFARRCPKAEIDVPGYR